VARPTGRLDVGGRSLFASCTGHVRPVVVLDAGLGAGAPAMLAVRRRLAPLRACVYDRAGRGHSDPLPRGVTQTPERAVRDLVRLLRRAGARPPYVLVGHSIGAIDVRLFARRHPSLTAGLVLVDGTPEAYVAGLPPAMSGDGERLRAAEAAELLARSPASPGPLIAIERGLDPDSLWQQWQLEVARRTPGALLVTALRSDHLVPQEQPGLVAAAARAVAAMARRGAALDGCPGSLAAAGGRCRPAAG
jgi:pimeloyl-ACP methyl ester carboxylesterase